MNWEKEIKRKAVLFCLAGVCLLGFAWFAPDFGGHQGLSFIQVARHSSWHHVLDWEAAWCSLKIILLSLGVCLVIESLGTWLMKIGHVLMGVSTYLLHIVPVMGLLAGSYYLIKSLL